jgi:hypothetical protein
MFTEKGLHLMDMEGFELRVLLAVVRFRFVCVGLMVSEGCKDDCRDDSENMFRYEFRGCEVEKLREEVSKLNNVLRLSGQKKGRHIQHSTFLTLPPYQPL